MSTFHEAKRDSMNDPSLELRHRLAADRSASLLRSAGASRSDRRRRGRGAGPEPGSTGRWNAVTVKILSVLGVRATRVDRGTS
jgi:hypothetical protein